VQRWEYFWELRKRMVRPQDGGVSGWDNDIPKKLRDLGEQGWELVAISPRSDFTGNHLAGVTTEELWVFKRPRE
jgi:hypothetical protein